MKSFFSLNFKYILYLNEKIKVKISEEYNYINVFKLN